NSEVEEPKHGISREFSSAGHDARLYRRQNACCYIKFLDPQSPRRSRGAGREGSAHRMKRLRFTRRVTSGQDNFFWAASGSSTLVLPTSLISTVVVRSISKSSPLKPVIVP